MSITPVTGGTQQPQYVRPTPTAKDNDGDEATESAAEKAQESSSTTSGLPADPNRGRAVNMLA